MLHYCNCIYSITPYQRYLNVFKRTLTLFKVSVENPYIGHYMGTQMGSCLNLPSPEKEMIEVIIIVSHIDCDIKPMPHYPT